MRNISRRVCALLVLVCLLVYPTLLVAQTNDQLAIPYNEQIRLERHSLVLQDPTGELTLDEVSSEAYRPKFRPYHPQDAIARFDRAAYWVHIQLRNPHPDTQWYLLLWGSLSRQWQVYMRPITTGDNSTANFQEQTKIAFMRTSTYQFNFATGQHYELYIRVQDLHSPLHINIDIYSSEELLPIHLEAMPLFSFAVGGLLTLALYNFIYFIALREKSFLALSLFIVCFTLELANHIGLLHYFPVINNLHYRGSWLILIAMAAGISFLTHLLQIKTQLPLIYRLFNKLFWLCLGAIPFTIALPYSLAIAILLGSSILILTTITLIALHLQQKRLPSILLLAVACFTIALTPSLLRGLGILEISYTWVNMLYFPLLLCVVLLSLVQVEQVRLTREQTERTAAQNMAKDEFLTTMSHELRTPMNSVINAGHLLQLTALSTKQRDYVDKLGISSRHMLDLINDILDLARANSQQLSLETIPFKLDDVVQQVKELTSEQARKKRLLLQVKLPSELPEQLDLLGDPTRLRQILLNLLANAIKFTNSGKVELHIKQLQHAEGQLELEFTISDTGIGISAEQQQRLFKPFSQADSSTNRQYGGSGLGLAISQKLVRRMGGELQVSSRLGHGSRFYFSLNFPTQTRTAQVVTPLFKKREVWHTPECILLVDDDGLNRFFTQQLLENLGSQVISAANGAEALQQLQDHSEHIDLILMDVSMPEMDGYETTRRIRAQRQYHNLPILALTAHAIVGEKERCHAAGMNDYLTKPFEMEQLRHKLNEWSQASAARYQQTS